MPTVDELQVLSAEKMSKQTLTHILHDSGDMDYLSLKFSDGSISPKEGNYENTPKLAKVAIPAQPEISQI